MTTIPETRPTWTCSECGTLATPANALVLNGGPVVHRGCVDRRRPAATPTTLRWTVGEDLIYHGATGDVTVLFVDGLEQDRWFARKYLIAALNAADPDTDTAPERT